MENFETKINKLFGDINKWFQENQLIFNYNKTLYLQFTSKNNWDCNLTPYYQGTLLKVQKMQNFWG